MKIMVRNEGEAIYVCGEIQKAANMLKMCRGIDDLLIQSMEIFLCGLGNSVTIAGNEEETK
jgi:hypothetical protein